MPLSVVWLESVTFEPAIILCAHEFDSYDHGQVVIAVNIFWCFLEIC
jgi:hypothetical protein